MSAQHTPGPVRLTDEELTALHESRDAAFHRKDWTEQARIQVLIDVEHIARWNEHVAAIAKTTGSAEGKCCCGATAGICNCRVHEATGSAT